MRCDLPLTVYLDGSCPLCHRELLNIKAHDTKGHLRLVDCAAETFDDAPFRHEGITRRDMMERLHVRDRQGAWIKGAPAMELIYRTAGMQRMARLWESDALLGRMYPWIARHRQALSLTGIPLGFALWTRYAAWRSHRRTGQCKTGNCPTNASQTVAAMDKVKRFLEKWLLLVAWGHVVAGIAIPLIAYSTGFDYYSALLHRAFWPGEAVPAQTVEFQRWIVALFGPTIASVGVVMVYLVRAGIRTGERWPWTAILFAMAVWAPGDIGLSLMRHFQLHVWIDVATLLAIVPAVLILKARAAPSRPHALSNR